jgi:ADP-heptose:LPS heptosyltransferase
VNDRSDPPAQKILVVRVGHGGDLVMITPALRALLEAFPTAELHLLTSAEGRRIMTGFDERLTTFHLYSRRFPHRLLLERRLRMRLREEAYDRIVILETKPSYQRWLGGAAPQVDVLADGPGHFSDRALDLITRIASRDVDHHWVWLPVTAEGRDRARALLAEHGVAADTQLVGLHPTFSQTGAHRFRDRRGKRHRMWPRESFARLAALLAERARADGRELAVVMDVLPDEAAYVQPIVDASGGVATVLAAPPDFQRYKGLLSLLDVLVTPNTGPMHMAAALETPVVALFSNWDPDDCGPYMDPARRRILRAEDTAQPELGLAAITPEQVAAAVLELLV